MASTMGSTPDLKRLSNSERGLYCEYLVYQKTIKKNLVFLGHQLKTPMAEIDVLFRHQILDRAIAIEVKTNSSADLLLSRVGLRQKMKLRAARLYLERDFTEVQMLLAVVSHDASIELFESFLS